jgi:hypothetical protein
MTISIGTLAKRKCRLRTSMSPIAHNPKLALPFVDTGPAIAR